MTSSTQNQPTPPDYVVPALDSKKHWGFTTVTYSFMNELPSYYSPDDSESKNFKPFTQEQKDGAERALKLWSDVAGIKFDDVTDAGAVGQIHFGTAVLEKKNNQEPFKTEYPGWAYHPNVNGEKGGDVWLSSNSNRYPSLSDQSDG